MKEFFHPSSVVIVGVSTKWGNLGKEIARNLLEFNFNGMIHLVGADVREALTENGTPDGQFPGNRTDRREPPTGFPMGHPGTGRQDLSDRPRMKGNRAEKMGREALFT